MLYSYTSVGTFQSLVMAKWLIQNAVPRTLHPWTNERCNLVFVDAAAESSEKAGTQVVTVGGVLFSPRLDCPEFFGFTVTADIVSHWQSSGSKQVVGQGELFPVWISKRVWKEVLSHSRNLWFIDNESAREGYVRSYSPSWSSREILLVAKAEDMKSSSVDWYSRVPTSANWADGPSRLDYREVLEIGGKHIEVSCPALSEFSGLDILKMLHAI